jgi:hypothetical protein
MCSGEPPQVLEVEVVKVGPFEAQGSYKVFATLYNNNEPVPSVDGGVVSGTSGLRPHRGGGDVRMDSGIALSGIHVDASSKVVFEVSQTKNSVIGAFCTHDMCKPSPVCGTRGKCRNLTDIANR